MNQLLDLVYFDVTQANPHLRLVNMYFMALVHCSSLLNWIFTEKEFPVAGSYRQGYMFYRKNLRFFKRTVLMLPLEDLSHQISLEVHILVFKRLIILICCFSTKVNYDLASETMEKLSEVTFLIRLRLQWYRCELVTPQFKCSINWSYNDRPWNIF